ncbi:thiol reductant ABC exporter subunit CydD [Salinicola avicenniae]|uniref:thiol reductant ABC exporter subunit CydD n=1 Tax=Salinicola avicenniae TaxID=2916836 RepID=UPI002073FD94|nr:MULTISPECIES: thiol reductant ABC exporter subunit CydD [unclassified Salinicola]
MSRATRAGNPSRDWLKRQAAGVRGWHRAAVACGLLAAMATLFQMGGMAWVVDRLVSHDEAPGDVVVALLVIGVALVVRSLAQWGQECCGIESGLRVRQQVRHALLDRLAALGPVRLASRHTAGLASQLVDQVEALDGYYARFLPQMVLAAAIPMLYLVVVLWLNWLAGIWLLIAAPLIPLFMALIGMGAQRLNEAQFQAVTRLSGHFLDRVRGIATLQLFGLAARSTAEVADVADDYRRRSLKTLRVAFLSSAVLEFFAAVSVAVVAIYIGFGLLGFIDYGPADELTLFSGLLILMLAPEFFQPLRALSQHYHDRASALGAAEGLLVLLDGTPVEGGDERASAVATNSLAPGEIALEAIELEHEGRGQVLGPVALHVSPGEVVALVGPSGSGKSSLLQLIAGFAAPSAGRVEVGADTAIAWLDQRPLLIQGSVAENLRLVAPAASDAELERALCHAGLGAWLAAAPAGIHTALGERGVGMSGGEAQRLALARVFLSPAHLVLLDEPTAALDPKTEQLVIEGLRRLAAEGRTLLVATHHPAIMGMAGRLYAIEQGHLVAVTAVRASQGAEVL